MRTLGLRPNQRITRKRASKKNNFETRLPVVPVIEFQIGLNNEMANDQDSQNISDFMINRIHFTQNFDFPSSKTDL